jgi:heat shock protein HslJ
MKNSIRIVLAAVLVLSGVVWAAADDANALASTKWKLAAIGDAGAPTTVVDGSEVTLEFGPDGRVSGSSGCNSYGADYTVRGTELTFGPAMSTKRACVEAARMQQEQRYFKALETAKKFEVADGILTIWFDDGKGVLSFTEGTAAAPTR